MCSGCGNRIGMMTQRVMARHHCDGEPGVTPGSIKDLGPHCRCWECQPTLWEVFESGDPAEWNLYHPITKKA